MNKQNSSVFSETYVGNKQSMVREHHWLARAILGKVQNLREGHTEKVTLN